MTEAKLPERQESASDVLEIYIIRHAETDSNVRKIIQGTLDTSLNATGHAQASCLARRLRETSFDAVFCSDLQRCRQTLQHVLEERPSPIPCSLDAASAGDDRCPVTYTPLLQERYMAELQGVDKDTVDKLCRESGRNKFDYGEGTKALRARVEKFWRQEIEPLYAAPNAKKTVCRRDVKRVCICSHGGTLLRLVASLVETFDFVPAGSDDEQANGHSGGGRHSMGELDHGAAPASSVAQSNGNGNGNVAPVVDYTDLKRPSGNTGLTILHVDRSTGRRTIELYADVAHLQRMGRAEVGKEKDLEVVDA